MRMKARLWHLLSCLGLRLLLIDLHDRLPLSAEIWAVTIDQHFFLFVLLFCFWSKTKEKETFLLKSNYLLAISWKEKMLVLLTCIIISHYFCLNLYLVTPKPSNLDPSHAQFRTEQESAGWSIGWQRKLLSRLQLDLVLQKLAQVIQIYPLR